MPESPESIHRKGVLGKGANKAYRPSLRARGNALRKINERKKKMSPLNAFGLLATHYAKKSAREIMAYAKDRGFLRVAGEKLVIEGRVYTKTEGYGLLILKYCGTDAFDRYQEALRVPVKVREGKGGKMQKLLRINSPAPNGRPVKVVGATHKVKISRLGTVLLGRVHKTKGSVVVFQEPRGRAPRILFAVSLVSEKWSGRKTPEYIIIDYRASSRGKKARYQLETAEHPFKKIIEQYIAFVQK